jgi:glycosyltransferase involved in cell wall biosynthesis
MRSTTQKQTSEEEISRLKEQGRQYLKVNQVGKALRIFSTVLKEHPDDIDCILILGDSYLMAGGQPYALVLYQQAYQLAPERRDIKRRINLLQTSVNSMSMPELIPTHPRAIADLIKKLTGQATQVSERDLSSASKLLDDYLNSATPAQAVAEHMDEINHLLPALIELNIRQARHDGQIDVVDALQEMLSNLLIQGDIEDGQTASNLKDRAQVRNKPQIFMGGVCSGEAPYRLLSMEQTLTEAGYEIQKLDLSRGDETINWERFDLVVAHNPHGSPTLSRGVAARAAANLPVLVDLAADFSHLPSNHPDYSVLGLDDPTVKRSYQASMQLASCISVPGEGFANLLRQASYPVETIPDGWNQYDFLWSRPSHNSPFFNLGLNLIAGQGDDVLTLRRAVTRVVREFPHTRLVLTGDMEIYQLFDNLPEPRKVFLPPVELEDYPYILAQMDLLLVPFKEDEFNRTRSDRRLMEAGVRRIPWIGSPIPAHVEWGSGGLLASTTDEWYAQLQTLIQDRELREKFGQSGYQKALQRENQALSKLWTQLAQVLIARKKG